MKIRNIILFFAAAFLLSSCSETNQDISKDVTAMDTEYKAFYDEITGEISKAYTDMALAYFDASTNSNPENWEKVNQYDVALNAILSNKDTFEKIKWYKDSATIKDELLSRSLDLIYLDFLSKQIDTAKLNQLSKMQSEIELKYSGFRAKVGSKVYDDNQIEEVLKTSSNQKLLKDIWEAHKNIGPLVKDDIINLVKLRNEVARELGFNNYHEMSLKLSDQNPEDISKLFDELDALTKDEFMKLKTEIDAMLTAKHKIPAEKLMPWHYQNRYFQEAPKIYEVDHDSFYKERDVVKLTEDYFRSINLPIEDLVAKSDLYPRENKNQHAYCINIDRDKRDIRVLCNVTNNARWMETMLHEYGHALYENHYADDLPWGLKSPAHIFTTEAVAMIFGRFALNPTWMQDMLGISDEQKEAIAEESRKMLKLQQLVFSRWSQVMYRFEKSMYADPDQDLNKLWWDLVEQYQMIKRPEGRDMPDWATKIHIATSPCYYHNYHLGELLASQLFFTISEKVLNVDPASNPSFHGKPEVGDFFIKKIFNPGTRYQWNDMIERATGEKLTAKYYAKQFVEN
ncbi:MAG: M2 family metallopeptidase [Candidatus Kapabacteria bacterium]|nr:M2 family metallopeptidase [Ignavibacteriota bacterium]MCW5884770.1 M2 family metallopeptidase [Candidatus Kapabacteria bacterium]